jgi:hypothetical protein
MDDDGFYEGEEKRVWSSLQIEIIAFRAASSIINHDETLFVYLNNIGWIF